MNVRRRNDEAGMVAAGRLGSRYVVKVSEVGRVEVVGGERHVPIGQIREFQWRNDRNSGSTTKPRI